jgi:hypothetical protein
VARINSFPDTLQDWESLLAALREHAELQAALDTERLNLENDLTEVRTLKARQETQNAGRQELTQQIKAVLAHGRAQAIAIRAVAKGKLGYRNERLVHFRVAPLRPRPRKQVAVVQPPAGEPGA